MIGADQFPLSHNHLTFLYLIIDRFYRISSDILTDLRFPPIEGHVRLNQGLGKGNGNPGRFTVEGILHEGRAFCFNKRLGPLQIIKAIQVRNGDVQL